MRVVTALPLIEEFVIGESDLASQGTGLLPGLAEHAAALLEGSSDVATSARHWSPALWSAIYSERSQSGRAVMPLTSAPRDTNLWHAGNATHPGLTAGELNQLIAFDVACVALTGHKPLLTMPIRFIASRLSPDSTEPCVAFVSLAFRALANLDWCAPWLGYGIAELPLEAGTDWDPADWDPEDWGAHDLTVSPFSWVKKIHPAIVAEVGPPDLPPYVAGQDWEPADWDAEDWAVDAATATAGWGAMHQAFMVDKVSASLWRDRAGDLCLVLANWTAAPATWSRRFSPWRYAGWGGNWSPADWLPADWATWPTWRVDLLESGVSDWDANDWDPADWGGSTGATPIATGITAGDALLCASGTAGAVVGDCVFLGPLPAFSIRAYRIRQE